MAGEAATATTITAGPTGTTSTPGVSTGGPSGIQNQPQQVATVTDIKDWTAALPEGVRGYVQSKGFKDAGQIAESYKNLETLIGVPKDRLLKLPESFDAPEMGEIYDRLGRPKNANEYAFATPENAKSNPEFTKFASELFHKVGVSKAQGEAIADAWNKYAVGDVEAQKQQQLQTLNTEKAALRKEWGAAYDQEIRKSVSAAKQFGLGEAEIGKLENALGFSATLKFLAKVGGKLGEDAFVIGGPGHDALAGALTPERAQSEIKELQKDKDFVRRYTSGEHEAKKKMNRLFEFAYPGMDGAVEAF